MAARASVLPDRAGQVRPGQVRVPKLRVLKVRVDQVGPGQVHPGQVRLRRDQEALACLLGGGVVSGRIHQYGRPVLVDLLWLAAEDQCDAFGVHHLLTVDERCS